MSNTKRTTSKMSPSLPAMMPSHFLRELPEVQDLAEDDECPVCLQNYVPTDYVPRNAPAPGLIARLVSMAVGRKPEPMETEHAVRLPCQHILGSKCIRRWISPQKGNQNTCPYCVQQLFTPVKYPVSEHPCWDTLIDTLGGYGFTMDTNGTWHWNQMQGAAALDEKDLVDARTLAKKHSAMLKKSLGPDHDTMATIQRVAVSRLTAHLRLTICYLQLQSFGVVLPAIEEVALNYSCGRLEKHQEAAFLNEFERRTGTRLDCEACESHRDLGVVPGIRWEEETNYYYFSFA